MNAPFTPGGWYIQDHGGVPSIINDALVDVARVGPWWPYDNEPQRQANARLIAAAPELLSALEAAVGLFPDTFADGGTIHKQMQDAIAKATQP